QCARHEIDNYCSQRSVVYHGQARNIKQTSSVEVGGSISMLNAELRISFDGSDTGGRSGDIAATIYFPPAGKITDNPTVVFALPGAGYNRRYFDLRITGHDAYSQSEFHVARGTIFVAMECAGSGDSHVSSEE